MPEKPPPIIEKASRIGFCFGVKRALDTLEKVARERGTVETLGAVVHNQQVIEELEKLGVRVVKEIEYITGNTVVTSSHGVGPETEAELARRGIEIVSTTCPFVRRAQVAARRLTEAGFFVVVYGNANHPEVAGILGWTNGRGLATTDEKALVTLNPFPRRLGILSQTTQVPANFRDFVKKVVDIALTKDAEIRIIDTICHDIPERQAAARELAQRSDLMLVVGGRASANTNRLAEISSGITESHLIETAAEIRPEWLVGKRHIGVTAGASTAEKTVDEVMEKLREMTGVNLP